MAGPWGPMRLRGRSRDELRVRGGQALSAWRERVRRQREPRAHEVFGNGHAATADELLERFRSRTTPCLSPAFADPARTAAALPAVTNRPELISRADRIVDSRVDLLGFRDLSFGSPIDWHFDPVSGERLPLVHWSRLVRLPQRSPVDRKIVWELNRHQWFVVLGRAYRVTNDERYAEAFARELSAWLERNPAEFGVNWSSSLEVALRAISWTWALWLFRDSALLAPDLFLRALRSLHRHARHVARYPSTYSSPNTHLTGEALGLYYVGTMWPELRGAEHWRATGREILLSELKRQVTADGVYFERSTAYHRYTIDFYAHFMALAGVGSDALPSVVRERLGALLDVLLYVTRPDGTMPLVGDDDGGRLLPLDERAYDDARPTLTLGAALLGRPDLKTGAGGPTEELLWLLGPSAIAAYEELESRPAAGTSRAFGAGGVYVMRDGWTESATVLTLDCGDHAGAHDHAGALGFDLALGGRPLLVDSGTHSYLRGEGRADRFRATAAHNTVVVDEQPSSMPAGPFRWDTRARAWARKWRMGSRLDFFQGAHDGYARLPDPVVHVRSVLFVKGQYVVIRDRLEAVARHRYDLRFHFAPSVRPLLGRLGGLPAVRGDGFELITFGPGSWRLSTEPVSRCYGTSKLAAVATLTAHADGPQEFVTFLLPGGSSAREVPAAGGQAFEVRVGNQLHLVAAGAGGEVEAEGASLETSELGVALARRVDSEWVVERMDT